MIRALLVLTYLIAQVIHAEPSPAAKRKFGDVFSEFSKSPEFQATQSTIRAIELDFATRDLVLQPQLEVAAKRFNEQREFYSYPPTRKRTDTLSAQLTKPFSTGTTVRVIPSFERALTPTLTPDHRSTFDWQIGISQSLWQDAFGRATRLRWSREGYERRQQLASALQTQAQAQVEFENLFWDWAMALRERELRAKNVTRAQEILRWIRGRYARSAAEPSDVLNAEALLASRELRVVEIQQTIDILTSRMERFVPGVNWQPDPEELAQSRPFESLLTSWTLDDLSEVQRLELVSVRNQALAAEKRAEEAREQIRPNLELQVTYGKNAIDPDSDRALRESFSDDYQQSTIGLVFKTGLDIGLERRKVESVRAARDSAKFKRAALEAEGRVAWSQLKNTLRDLNDRVSRARRLTDVQLRKANAERQRYRLGRSTAFQAITYEQEAAEAEITLWNLYALMRKTEAQARLFAR